MPSVAAILPKTKGFDCNTPLNADAARRFMDAGYRFAVRYVPRMMSRPSDLTQPEIQTLHRGGLAVMPVQHVESEKAWTPSLEKGVMYGTTAAVTAKVLGIGSGTTVWLDLEGVAPTTPAGDVIAYCNAWFDQVKSGGFEPGLYVGWRCGLNASQLYFALKFRVYWAAYNLNSDRYPAVRGVCMKQSAGSPPAGVHFPIDIDTVHADMKGGLPHAFAPDEWDIG